MTTSSAARRIVSSSMASTVLSPSGAAPAGRPVNTAPPTRPRRRARRTAARSRAGAPRVYEMNRVVVSNRTWVEMVSDPIDIARFWVRVDKTATCWLWKGSIDSQGYGRLSRRPRRSAHRFSYQLLIGPIPPGRELDHLCRVRHCVNPDHLEAVTRRVNILRGMGAPAVLARAT